MRVTAVYKVRGWHDNKVQTWQCGQCGCCFPSLGASAYCPECGNGFVRVGNMTKEPEPKERLQP
jgi:rubrerythrin